MAERVWTKLSVDQEHTVPTARSGHSAILYEGFMGIFGGIFEVTKELNDLHLYDIANNRWICLFNEKTEPVTAQSPTKTMAMGSVSPLMRRGTKAGDMSPGVNSNNGKEEKAGCKYADANHGRLGMEQPVAKKMSRTDEESKKP